MLRAGWEALLSASTPTSPLEQLVGYNNAEKLTRQNFVVYLQIQTPQALRKHNLRRVGFDAILLTWCCFLNRSVSLGPQIVARRRNRKNSRGKCRRSSWKTHRFEGSRRSRLASSSGAWRFGRFLPHLHTDPKASTVQRMDLRPTSDFRSRELLLLLLYMWLSSWKTSLISSVCPNRR